MKNIHSMKKWGRRKLKLGLVEQKILLLLMSGLILGLTKNPMNYFKIIKSTAKEWQKINRKSLHAAIRKLYQSKMIGYRENKNGTVQIILEDEGKTKALHYNLDTIHITKPHKWDGLWRIIAFDIPEKYKKGRDALSVKLKQLGFKPLQKSVFICPYECKDAIEFLCEIFEVRPYVRYITANTIDNILDLKEKFGLL